MEDAKKYNRIKVRLKLTGLTFIFVYLTFFQVAISRGLKEATLSVAPNFYLAFTLYLVGFSLLYYILGFPLQLYSSFILEHRFKLSTQRFFAWLADDIKSGVISLFIFIIFVHALYFCLKSFPATWWIWIGAFWFLATVFLAKITPLVIIPLFFKYSPVSPPLKERVIKLADKCGIKILNVYKIDFSKKTKKLNAAVVGLGKTRRVILADNLVNEFSEDEVAGVLAHEFAHHKFFHMWQLIAFGALTTFASFYVLYLIASKIAVTLGAESIHDMLVFPAFMGVLFIMSFVTLPLQNGFSRRLEREADSFALKATQDKEVFVSLMQKLGERNLADPNPSKIIKFLFYSHPPIAERIKSAKEFST
ncbi:M48 family metallopeptidase [Candidatus Omnitrophota bacterium]